MRRLRAGWVSVAFYAGLALLCASAAELAHWPALHVALDRADLVCTPDAAILRGDFWLPFSFPSEWERFEPAQLAIVISVLLALVATALVFARRHAVGGALLTFSALLGLLVFGAAALELRLTPAFGSCSYGGHAQDGRELVRLMRVVAISFAACAGASWLVVQRRRGLLQRASAVPAFAIAWTMIVGAVWGQVALIIPSLAAGVALALTRGLFTSRLVSILIFCSGCLASIPALAVRHDRRLDLHEQPLLVPSRLVTAPAPLTCIPGDSRPTIAALERQVLYGGALIEAELTSRLVERLRDEAQRYRDLHLSAGQPAAELDAVIAGTGVNLMVARETPMTTITAILAAVHQSEFRTAHVVFVERSPGATWTRPTIEEHVCTAAITFAEDGAEIDAFPDWESLARAAPVVLRPF